MTWTVPPQTAADYPGALARLVAGDAAGVGTGKLVALEASIERWIGEVPARGDRRACMESLRRVQALIDERPDGAAELQAYQDAPRGVLAQTVEVHADDFGAPAARARFAAWYEASPLTRDGRGRRTYKRLAELLGVAETTAKRYAAGATPLSVDAAAMLCALIGQDAYDEMVSGDGDAECARLRTKLAAYASTADAAALRSMVEFARVVTVG